MNEKTCPRCGAAADGAFCSQCGASLESRSCTQCGAESPPGDRFCTQCGASLSGGRAGVPAGGGGGSERDGSLGWWVAGLVMVALILFMVVPVLAPDRGQQEAGAPPPTGSVTPGGGAPPDLSSMTPRQAADRLFNRVMQAGETGDTAEVQTFLPMAISAYERARPLDADGFFHLSSLQRTGSAFEAALETAEAGLQSSPDHLLLLSAAGEAATALNDTATARRHYSHLLEVWPVERERDLEEYELHSALLPSIREDAESFLEGS